jgi:plasmid stabilization system protein ParE
MKVVWTDRAAQDLDRLHDFLSQFSPRAADQLIVQLVAAPEVLLRTPRLGQRVERGGPEEVRRILVRDYELRYEVKSDEILVLRIWHTREER